MNVRIADTRPGHFERFVMDDGAVYWVDRHGWVLDSDKRPVAHPAVDDVMAAIVAWDASR